MAVRIDGASSSGEGCAVKSWNDGPALRRSRKIVGERRVVDVRGATGSVGSDTAVAKVRVVWGEGRTIDRGGAKRQRNLVALEAIMVTNEYVNCVGRVVRISERRLDIDFGANPFTSSSKNMDFRSELCIQ